MRRKTSEKKAVSKEPAFKKTERVIRVVAPKKTEWVLVTKKAAVRKAKPKTVTVKKKQPPKTVPPKKGGGK